MHWHGLHLDSMYIGLVKQFCSVLIPTPGADSVDGGMGISSCGIKPGESFTYNLTIPASQSGTFWYHSHAGLSMADGLYGGLVIHTPAAESNNKLSSSSAGPDAEKYGYDKELLLLIGDWYHQPAHKLLSTYMYDEGTDVVEVGDSPYPYLGLMWTGLG